MKRSDFFAKRQDHWSAILLAGDDPGASASTLAARDAVAADVAGVQWDPEEPELPRRIVATKVVDCDGWHLLPAVPGGPLSDEEVQRIYFGAVDAYNRFRSGELVEKSLLDGAWKDLSGRIAENARLREELRRSEARQPERAIGVDILLEKTTARLEETTTALQRLAREAGVPDEGPDEIVDAVLAEIERLASRCSRMSTALCTIARAASEGRR